MEALEPEVARVRAAARDRRRADAALEVIERLVPRPRRTRSSPAARSCSRSAPARRARSQAMMEAAGLDEVAAERDQAGIERVVWGRWA